QFVATLADVATDGDHFAAVRFYQPGNDDGCVQPARVGERHLLWFCHKFELYMLTAAPLRSRLLPAEPRSPAASSAELVASSAEHHHHHGLLPLQPVLGLAE